jgi:putative ABC transport system permease protein
MLYTFANASTNAQISADLAKLTAALPAGAIAHSISWLGLDGATATTSSENTPFVVAFAIIGVVLAVLIVASLANAAVATGYRRIGVLKSLGFTPAQVACVYLVQIGDPGADRSDRRRGARRPLGAASAQRRAVQSPTGAAVDRHHRPGRNVRASCGATLVPALRAGRLSSVQAIAAGQAPRAGHAYLAHRLAATLRRARSRSGWPPRSPAPPALRSRSPRSPSAWLRSC